MIKNKKGRLSKEDIARKPRSLQVRMRPRGNILKPTTASRLLFSVSRVSLLIRRVLVGRLTTLIKRVSWLLSRRPPIGLTRMDNLLALRI